MGGRFTEHVGSKTTFRMLNHQRSTTACCRGKLPENYTTHDPVTVLLWHPGAQTDIAESCQRFYPRNRVVGLSRGFILKVGASDEDEGTTKPMRFSPDHCVYRQESQKGGGRARVRGFASMVTLACCGGGR